MISDRYKKYENSILNENDIEIIMQEAVDFKEVSFSNNLYVYKIFFNDGSKIKIKTKCFI